MKTNTYSHPVFLFSNGAFKKINERVLNVKALHSKDFFVNSLSKRLPKLAIITKQLIAIIIANFKAH